MFPDPPEDSSAGESVPESISCDDCGESTEGALARSVELHVDGSEVDVQRLCPNCFAEWIDLYQREMQAEPAVIDSSDENIIVD